MSWFWSSTNSWGRGHGGLRLVVRLVGVSFFGYLLIAQGAFGGPEWVSILTGLALLILYGLSVLRTLRPFDRRALVLTTTVMVCGVLINARLDSLGTVFFVVGGLMLIGQPDVALPLSLGLVAGVGVLGLASALAVQAHWPVLVSTSAAVLAIALFGANRRQVSLREQQDRALAARSRELEERNAQLVAQTELTRQEAARVAALEERGRIARDLHDVLAHSLGGLIVQLDAAEAELSHGAEQSQVGARLRTSRRLAVDGLRGARAAVAELHPDDDAESAGRDLVESLRTVVHGPVGIQLGAELEVIGEPRTVSAPVQDALTSVTREALTNVNKHAPGARLSATLVFEPDRLRLEVVNGLAVGGSRSELAGTGSGAGLTGSAQRLTSVGGRFSAGPEGRRWVVSADCPSPSSAEPYDQDEPDTRDLHVGPAKPTESSPGSRAGR